MIQSTLPAKSCYDYCAFYRRHTDLIQNGQTLLLTTVVLASKIFSSIPDVVANLSMATLKYTGILFINAQVMHLQKSAYDLKLALTFFDFKGILLTALKVSVKSANIFLIISGFVMPIISLIGFKVFSASLLTLLLPISRSSWVLSCFNEISDYYQNQLLYQELSALNLTQSKNLITNFKTLQSKFSNHRSSDYHLALRLIRQNEGSTLEIFKNSLTHRNVISLPTWQTQLYIREFQASLYKKNTLSESGSLLSGLGYTSMHVSKLYPDGIVEWGLRWNMSLLYFIKTIDKKFFQAEQEKRIA